MSNSKYLSILNKIKAKTLIFEYIQGFVSHRHYILPHLIENDKTLQESLTILNNISTKNKLSSNFIDNLYTFLSDRMFYEIINKEDIINNNNFFYENKNDTIIDKYIKRISYIYKKCKYYNNYNTSNISNEILEKYIPQEKDFHLFILDFLSLQKNNPEEIKNILSNYNFKHIQIENNMQQKEINEDIYTQYQRKPNINIVFIGNAQSGKSTTIGHLLYDTGNIDINEFQKIKNESYEIGIYSDRYAWIMDKYYHERTYSHSINNSSIKLETEKNYYTLIDIPGQKRLIRNALRGIFEGDISVIVVPADENKLKDLFSDKETLKDHIIAAYTMGIKQAIIAINQIDICNYSENICIKIKEKVKKFLNQIGFDNKNIQYVYYSGITGQNLVNRIENDSNTKKKDNFKFNKTNKTPWYKGDTLLESFQKIKIPKRLINKPLCISVEKYQRITGVGIVIYGVIKTGILIKDMDLYFSIKKTIVKGKCESIEKYNNNLDIALPGDIISIKINKYYYIHTWGGEGHLILSDNKNKLPVQVNELTCLIYVMNVPNSIKKGYKPILYCHKDYIPVEFIKILYKLDGRTNKILNENDENIKNGERAVVLLKPIYPPNCPPWRISSKIVCEKYNDNSFLGSVIIMDYNKTIAVGKILEINKEKIENEINLDEVKQIYKFS